MFYLDSQLNRYYVGTPFTYNEIQYTVSGATHETFVALGFTPVTVEPQPSDLFYIVGELKDDGTYDVQERDLAELKVSFIGLLKADAHRVLSRTDWYIIRALESGILGTPSTVPAGASNYRSQVRSVVDAREAAINACTTVQELETLITTPVEYPEELGGY